MRRRFDMSRVASAAIDAALTDQEAQPQRRGGSALRGVAVGAALAAAARIAVARAPGLPSLSGLSEIPERVRDGLIDRGWLEDDDDERVDDALEDEELEDEEAEPPEAELDDEEPEVQEDGGAEEPPPALARSSRRRNGVDPASRPPRPPKSSANERQAK